MNVVFTVILICGLFNGQVECGESHVRFFPDRQNLALCQLTMNQFKAARVMPPGIVERVWCQFEPDGPDYKN